MNTYFRNLTILSVICIIMALIYFFTPVMFYPLIIGITLYIAHMIIGFIHMKNTSSKEEQERKQSIENEKNTW